MATELRGIGSLWVEGPLSFLEKMCLLSFVAAGHKVTLFHYGKVEDVPSGVDLVDAREIHDPSSIIYNKQFGTPVVQSDVFRLHMMQKTDLIWADTDMLCLEPIDAGQSHIFGYFKGQRLCNAVMRLPKESPGLSAYLDYVQDEYPIPPHIGAAEQEKMAALKARGEHKHASEQAHSVYGPAVFTWFMQQSGEISHAAPQSVYYPVPFGQAGVINDLTARELRAQYLKDDTLAIHLWGRRFRWWVRNRGVKRHSLLDRRLRGLGIEPRLSPIPTPKMRGQKRPVFPPNLPPQQTAMADIIAETPGGSLGKNYQREIGQYVRVAELSLKRMRAEGRHAINDPLPIGTSRGYDYYATEPAKVFAVARSLHRYTVNHQILPDLVEPKTITEKLLVMKLFGAVPNISPADKLVAESTVPAKVRQLLTPIKRVWQSDQPTLPANDEVPAGNYWLKANFGQGQNIRVSFPVTDDNRAAHNTKMQAWSTQQAHGFWAGEWWYADIPRRFFLEEDLAEQGEDITDWKLWTVAGRVEMVQVDRDRSSKHIQMIYDRDFNFIPKELYFATSDAPIAKPPNFKKMIQIAEGIGQVLEFARVDLYNLKGKILLGEITLCPFGGKRKMRTPEIDQALGAAWVGTRLFPNTTDE